MTGRAAIMPPSSLARRLVRSIVGFSAGVGLGLAVFLGTFKVTGYLPLLELFPQQMQTELIIFSSLLLGLVVVVVEFYATGRSPTKLLDRYFAWLLKALLAAVVLLVVLYQTTVESFSFNTPDPAVAGKYVSHRQAVLVGWFQSDAKDCSPGAGRIQAVKEISVDPARIDKCWKYLQVFRVALTLPYLFLLSGFGTLVGLLVLRQEERRRQSSSARAQPVPAKPGRGPKRPGGKAGGVSRPSARGGAKQSNRSKRPPAVDDPRDRL